MSKDEDPVTQNFCDERTRRIEEKIEAVKNEIIAELKNQHSMSWQAKATLLGSVSMSAASIIVAIIQVTL